MNPVLKKLRSGKLSSLEIAALLEKHIGDGTNKEHCRDACKNYAQFTEAILMSAGGNYCDVVRWVIDGLRSGGVE